MTKLLLILIMVVIAAHVVTSFLRGNKRLRTLDGAGVDRDKINRDKAIDVEYTEIAEENGAGSGS
jgi:hypothetical protein